VIEPAPVRRLTVGLVGAFLWAIGLTSLAHPAVAQNEPYEDVREEMVRRYIASVHPLLEPIDDQEVIEALRAVPRHEFVPRELRDAAYLNQPLPIGHGQTISQPYIVALMTQLLELDPGDRTLEIGTGSGYQAAVLAEIVDSVFTIEIIEPLATSAWARLRRLGYAAVRAKHGDGYFGWPEHGPFDGIVVTAAATHIPPPLVEQLAVGGRMVIPVGPPFRTQQLMLLEKRTDGSVAQRSVAPVAFVPFTRGEPER
jgi:protein-L-isoaspartate(D-aspartate) O-methyltransferase